MKAAIAELVSVILQHLEEGAGKAPSEQGVRLWLTKKGYNKRDIDAALALVAPRFARPITHAKHSPAAVRHLSSYEACKLSAEARDALVRIELYELIEPHERELLLERLGQFEGEVSMDDLDYLLSWLLYSTRDVESQQTIYSVFEANPTALN